jgi:hypothetical protein
LEYLPLLDPDWWKIDGKVSASNGFWIFDLFNVLSRGWKNRAHWMGGEELMKWDQARRIRVAFVRRVRMSRFRRISSKISGMESAWDWAGVKVGAIKMNRKKNSGEISALCYQVGTIEPHICTRDRSFTWRMTYLVIKVVSIYRKDHGEDIVNMPIVQL